MQFILSLQSSVSAVINASAIIVLIQRNDILYSQSVDFQLEIQIGGKNITFSKTKFVSYQFDDQIIFTCYDLPTWEISYIKCYSLIEEFKGTVKGQFVIKQEPAGYQLFDINCRIHKQLNMKTQVYFYLTAFVAIIVFCIITTTIFICKCNKTFRKYKSTKKQYDQTIQKQQNEKRYKETPRLAVSNMQIKNQSSFASF